MKNTIIILKNDIQLVTEKAEVMCINVTLIESVDNDKQLISFENKNGEGATISEIYSIGTMVGFDRGFDKAIETTRPPKS